MSILCKVFGHSVKTTHTNRYQVLRQVCKRCGLSRKLEYNDTTGMFYWEYNNGLCSKGTVIFSEGDIKFGRIE